MQQILPLIPIALGSAGLVALREHRLVLGALLLQWVGLAWAMVAALTLPAALSALAAEAITLLVCGALFGTSLRGLRTMGNAVESRTSNMVEERALPGVYEGLWLLAMVLAGGLVGVSLAILYPLGGTSSESLMAFYWSLLAGVLMLVVDGARNPVKLAAGLLALANSIVLLIVMASPTVPGPLLLGSLAFIRIGLAALMAYAWTLMQTHFGDLYLGLLFDLRSPSKQPLQTALVTMTTAHHPSSMEGGSNPDSSNGEEPEGIAVTSGGSVEPGEEQRPNE